MNRNCTALAAIGVWNCYAKFVVWSTTRAGHWFTFTWVGDPTVNWEFIQHDFLNLNRKSAEIKFSRKLRIFNIFLLVKQFSQYNISIKDFCFNLRLFIISKKYQFFCENWFLRSKRGITKFSIEHISTLLDSLFPKVFENI